MIQRREFERLLTGSFISQSGSHFLTLAVSAFVFSRSQSIVLASLVFVASFLPAVFVSSRLGHWIDRSLSRSLLIGNELLSIVMTVVCGLCLLYESSFILLCLILSLRSIFSFVGRTATNTWIKATTPPNLQASRFKIYSLTLFLSTAVSGALAATVLSFGSIKAVIGIDILSYIVAALIYRGLSLMNREEMSEVSSLTTKTLWSTVVSILENASLRRAFFWVIASQALFQGAYSTLVTYLPLQALEMGLKGVGFFQCAASLGIILGFFIVWMRPDLIKRGNACLYSFFGLSMGALIVAISSISLSSSLLGFLLLNMGYEVIWLSMSAEFFRLSPADSTARFHFTLSTTAAFLMSLFTLFYAIAIQIFGLLLGVLLLLIVIFFAGFLLKGLLTISLFAMKEEPLR